MNKIIITLILLAGLCSPAMALTPSEKQLVNSQIKFFCFDLTDVNNVIRIDKHFSTTHSFSTDNTCSNYLQIKAIDELTNAIRSKK